MAYDGDELNLVSPAPLTGVGKTWMYKEAATAATIDAAGYFSDSV